MFPTQLILLFFHLLPLATAAATAPAPSPADPSASAAEIPLLLKFKNSLSNSTSLSNWNPSTLPCASGPAAWAGVRCDETGGVWNLQLENMGLSGPIDVDSLALLPRLRSISLMNNSFSGPLPPLSRIPWLKSLFISGNRFSGPVDDGAFAGMGLLKKVYMSGNEFSGEVPASLAELPKLLELALDRNGFEGRIPEFKSSDLRMVDFSNNHFSGRIPESLIGFNSSSFVGNPGLCGQPLELQCKVPPTRAKGVIIAMIVTTLALILLISIVFLVKRNRQAQGPQSEMRHLSHDKAPKNNNMSHPGQDNGTSRGLDRPSSYRKSDNGKLCFLKNERDKFEMQDLLKASAEVLGSGSFGSSYKAALPAGPSMVVKRFRQMNNVGKDEFQDHMKRLGRLRHQNLLPIVAYFHKRDEKLLISEYVENGSLASHLHSNRTPGQAGLSWPIRLKIVKGVARGLAYLYRELSQLPLPHGHLKSSNVLLDDSFEPLLCDYSLSPVINREHAEQVMVAYKSPEFTIHNFTTKKTDVWCLGILILEILTGKFPANYLKHGKGASDDLATWVSSVVKGEWEGEAVFDVEMGGTRNAQGEMMKLLKVGMWCCEWNEEKRWSLREAVQKIEELKERDREERGFPSYGSQGSMKLASEDRLSFRKQQIKNSKYRERRGQEPMADSSQYLNSHQMQLQNNFTSWEWDWCPEEAVYISIKFTNKTGQVA
ncbi:hypothetical protein V2J09_008366 [Rumex salicifolius]